VAGDGTTLHTHSPGSTLEVLRRNSSCATHTRASHAERTFTQQLWRTKRRGNFEGVCARMRSGASRALLGCCRESVAGSGLTVFSSAPQGSVAGASSGLVMQKPPKNAMVSPWENAEKMA
jgi:hypothetical protein